MHYIFSFYLYIPLIREYILYTVRRPSGKYLSSLREAQYIEINVYPLDHFDGNCRMLPKACMKEDESEEERGEGEDGLYSGHWVEAAGDVRPDQEQIPHLSVRAKIKWFPPFLFS